MEQKRILWNLIKEKKIFDQHFCEILSEHI